MSVEAVETLAVTTTGPVLDGGSPDARAAELAGFNTAVTHADPVVVGAADAHDVRAAVRWAARSGRPVAVQATGHGGVSTRDAVVITTGRMRGVWVDPVGRTARVRAGTRWEEVVEAAARVGLAPLNGSSPQVGVVGYTTGAGVPVLGRTFGFAADHVRSLEMVTADGVLRRVDPTHEPDLFWAVRGTHGAFGVVTSMEFDLVDVRRVAGGSLAFTGPGATAVLEAYPAWASGLPEATTTSLAVMRLPDSPAFPEPVRGRAAVVVKVVHTGRLAEAEAAVRALRGPVAPVLGRLRDLPYAEIGSMSDDPVDPLPTWGGGVHLGPLDAAGVQTLVRLVGPDQDSPLTMVELRPMDGAFARAPRHPNAVGGRGAAWSLGVTSLWLPPVADAVRAAAAELFTAVDPWWDGTVSLNFTAAPRFARWAGRGWPPDVLRRLLEIKRVYDPDNVFRTGFRVEPTTTRTGTELTETTDENSRRTS